jgi:hypothetical protein
MSSTGEPDHLAGYAPTHPARLVHAAAEPPPLPSGDRIFGGQDEDGLNMLAALETLSSLEPDYADDIIAEASVTIVECADEDLVQALAQERRGAPSPLRPPPAPASHQLLLNGYENFLSPGDEAEIEIVEIAHTFEPTEHTVAERTAPASLAERLAAAAARQRPTSRFLKALSGDE